MSRKCDTCGCPLGDADIAAAQCPVCRKTLWRHVVEQAPVEKAADEKPVYQGTLLPPTFPEQEVEEFESAVPEDSVVAREPGGSVPDDAPFPPFESDRKNAATIETDFEPVLETAKETDRSEENAATILPEVTSRETIDLPNANPGDAGTITVTSAGAVFETKPPSSPRHGGTVATLDPRNFDDDDWEQWERKLVSSIGDGSRGAVPTAASLTADLSHDDTTAANASPKDSRYVGKTSVAARILAPPDRTPPAAADYALGDALGAGGMGIVYEATQRSINRSVALKMLKPEAARRRDRRDSLATEAIVTGELTHPNIVPIHDLGQDGAGNLFYSMKRVEGARWDEALSRKSQAENLEVFLKVADAIAFAHSRGVVHRDLKPENVLLGGFGEVLVMDWGLAYATDRFRKLDSITTNAAMGGSPAYMAPEQATAFLISGGWRAGKMPPITPAIDIYLLGAILFEIASGRPPHEGDDPALCVVAAADNQIRDVDSTSGLLSIALKAMETDPAERYATVEQLQSAVREFGRNAESVALAERASTLMNSGDLARAVVGFEDALELWPENPSATTQVVVARRRLTRRRYAAIAMTAAFLLAIGFGGLGINYQRLQAVNANTKLASANLSLEQSVKKEQAATTRAESAATRAERSAKLAKKNRVLAQVDEIRAKWAAVRETKASRAADVARVAALDAKTLAERERERQRFQNYQGRIKLIDARIEENAFAEADRLLAQLADESPDLCGWEWGRLKYLCTQGRRSLETESPVTAAAATPDGRLIVTGDAAGRVRSWTRGDATSPTDSPRNEYPDVGIDRVTAIAVSQDARLIAAAGIGTSEIVLFRTDEDGETAADRLAAEHSPDRPPASLDFSADGTRLLSAGAGGLTVWNTTTGRVLARSAVSGRSVLPVTCAAISPDGNSVVAGLADGQVLVWHASDPESLFAEAHVFDGHRASAEFGDGFRYLAGHVTSIAFLPDSNGVVSGDDNGRLLRWRTDMAVPRGGERDLAAAFTAAVSATRGDRQRSLTSAGSNVADVAAHSGMVSTISVKSDGAGHETVITGGADGLIKVWQDVASWPLGRTDPEPLAVLRGHEGRIASAAGFEAPGNGLNVVSAGVDATTRLWDVSRYDEVREVRPMVFADHEQEILDACFDPGGGRLLTAGRDEKLVVTDLTDRSAEPQQSMKVHSEAISIPWIVPFANGDRFATGYLDGSFAIWNVPGRTTLARVTPNVGASLTPPAVSPDGRWIAASYRQTADDRSIAVWSIAELTAPDAAHPEPTFVFEPRGEVFAVVFTSDGRLVFGDRSGPDRPAGGYVYVADLESEELLTHRVFGDGVEGRVYGLEALPDGDILAAGSPAVGRAVQIVRLDPSSGAAEGPAFTLAGSFLPAMAVSGDGRWLATLTNTSGNGTQSLELWDLDSSKRRWDVSLSDVRITALDIAPDGESLLTITEPVRRDGNKITATGSSQARLLELTTGEERRFGPNDEEPLLPGSSIASNVSGAAWSADGRSLFLASIRGVTEWSVDDRRRIPGTFDSHGAISATGFSADGRFIVDGHRDGSFDVRDAAASRLTPVFHQPPVGSNSPIVAAVFSPLADSHRLLIATEKSLTLRDFDPVGMSAPVERAFLTEPKNASLRIKDVAFSADEQWIAAACTDGATRVWSVENDRPAIVLRRHAEPDGLSRGHVGAVTAVAFPQATAPQGFFVVATGGADRNILVWVIETRANRVATVVSLRGHRGEITDLDFLPNRIDALVSASSDGTAKLWDWNRGGLSTWSDKELAELGEPEEVLTLGGRHTAGLTAVDVSHDGLTILTAGRDGRAVLWPSVAPPHADTSNRPAE